MPITVQARRDFVREVVALSVWLARRLDQQGTPFTQALTRYTNSYRLTTLWDGQHHPADPSGWRDPRWDELMQRLDHLHQMHPPGDAPPQLEAEALDLLWPLLEPRLERDVAAWPRCADRPFGFFSYRVGDRRWDEGWLTLHLLNPFAPASPFDDPACRARELAALIHHALRQCPAQHTLHCSSWLSSFGPFQALFPPEFASSASPPWELAYHYGWWGQFIDRRGAFHHGNGQWLRRTGRFRYSCITCTCSIESALDHLRRQFGADGSEPIEPTTIPDNSAATGR